MYSWVIVLTWFYLKMVRCSQISDVQMIKSPSKWWGGLSCDFLCLLAVVHCLGSSWRPNCRGRKSGNLMDVREEIHGFHLLKRWSGQNLIELCLFYFANPRKCFIIQMNQTWSQQIKRDKTCVQGVQPIKQPSHFNTSHLWESQLMM